jgi:hypothetical protein
MRSRPPSGSCGAEVGLLSAVGVLRLRSSNRGPSVLREAALFLVSGPAERRGESGDGGSPAVRSGFLSGSVCLPLALPPLAPDLFDMDVILLLPCSVVRLSQQELCGRRGKKVYCFCVHFSAR